MRRLSLFILFLGWLPICAGADVFQVHAETSVGDFSIEVHREWAPAGAERFEERAREKVTRFQLLQHTNNLLGVQLPL